MWQYDDKTNKSSCLVKVGSDVNTKPCGLQLVGKNPTNLKIGRGGDLGGTGGTVPQKFEVGGPPMHWSPQYFEK